MVDGLVAKSCQTLGTLWTVACQVPLSMEFPRQEYWSGLPFPSPGDLPNPEIELLSLKSPELAGRFFSCTEALQTCFLHKQKKKEKRKNSPIKTRAKDLNRRISKEYIQMANKHTKRCRKHLQSSRNDIKTTKVSSHTS